MLRSEPDNVVAVFVNNERAGNEQDLLQKVAQAANGVNQLMQIVADKDVPYEEITRVLNVVSRLGNRCTVLLSNQYADFDFLVQVTITRPAAVRVNGAPVQGANPETDDALRLKISQVPGVKLAVAFQGTVGAIDTLDAPNEQNNGAEDQSQIVNVMINGWSSDSPLFERLKALSGQKSLRLGNPRDILIGHDLAQTLKKGVGDEVRLFSGEQYKIAGVYFSRRPTENNSVIMALPELQRLMNRPGQMNTFAVMADRPLTAAERTALRKKLAAVSENLIVTPIDATTESKNPKPPAVDSRNPAPAERKQ